MNLYSGLIVDTVKLVAELFLARLFGMLSRTLEINDQGPSVALAWRLGVNCASTALLYPFTTVRVCLQAGQYPDTVSCVKGIYNKRGITGFYQGCSLGTSLTLFWTSIAGAFKILQGEDDEENE
jgi:hypothetical protein